jgi:hypothetical protein
VNGCADRLGSGSLQSIYNYNLLFINGVGMIYGVTHLHLVLKNS